MSDFNPDFSKISKQQWIGLSIVMILLIGAKYYQQTHPFRACIYTDAILKTQKLTCPEREEPLRETFILNRTSNKYLECYFIEFPPTIKPEYCENRTKIKYYDTLNFTYEFNINHSEGFKELG